MDFLEAVPFDKIFNGSGWAVAFWTVLYATRLVFRGDLVPRKAHEDTQSALNIERARNELLLKQLEKATDSMETFERFVKALPQPPTPPVRGANPGARPRRGVQGRSHQQDDWGDWDPLGGSG